MKSAHLRRWTRRRILNVPSRYACGPDSSSALHLDTFDQPVGKAERRDYVFPNEQLNVEPPLRRSRAWSPAAERSRTLSAANVRRRLVGEHM
jgi:hypothetical protein